MSWCSEIRKPQAESNLAQNTPSPKSLETVVRYSHCVGYETKVLRFQVCVFSVFKDYFSQFFSSCHKQNTKTAKVALRATVSPHGRSLPGFCSTKQLGVPYFFPCMGYDCIAGIPLSFSPIPIYTPGFRETKWSKWNNTMHNADTGNLQSPSHLLEHFAAWKVRETAHTERWSVSTYFDENCSLKTSTLPSPDRNSDALTTTDSRALTSRDTCPKRMTFISVI